MSTLSEIRALIKPFVELHPDFFIQGRRIAIRPLHQVLRCLYIDGSSGKGAFRPYWGVYPLCLPTLRVNMGYGFFFVNRSYGAWIVDKPNTRQVLLQEIEAQALPKIYPVNTNEDFMEFIATYHDRQRIYNSPENLFITYSALGNFDAACAIWINILSKWTERHYSFFGYDEDNMRRRQSLGACLMNDDRAGIAALLHEFEAFTVTSNKLEKIWQPTPFDWES
jgi:hypothetical protein